MNWKNENAQHCFRGLCYQVIIMLQGLFQCVQLDCTHLLSSRYFEKGVFTRCSAIKGGPKTLSRKSVVFKGPLEITKGRGKSVITPTTPLSQIRLRIVLGFTCQIVKDTVLEFYIFVRVCRFVVQFSFIFLPLIFIFYVRNKYKNRRFHQIFIFISIEICLNLLFLSQVVCIVVRLLS